MKRGSMHTVLMREVGYPAIDHVVRKSKDKIVSYAYPMSLKSLVKLVNACERHGYEATFDGNSEYGHGTIKITIERRPEATSASDATSHKVFTFWSAAAGAFCARDRRAFNSWLHRLYMASDRLRDKVRAVNICTDEPVKNGAAVLALTFSNELHALICEIPVMLVREEAIAVRPKEYPEG